MLRKRLIACLVVKDGIVVQSIGFCRYLPVGRVRVAVEFLNAWGVDEIVLLDIDATREGRAPNYELIREASRFGFVPLTVGGGIKSVDDMREVLHAGADKIAMNRAALDRPQLVEEGAKVFGAQCMMVSIDVKQGARDYEVFADSGKTATGRDPFAYAREVERLGAGEILLNSIDRDGCKQGYDLELIRRMTSAVNIPVIVCGGVGHPQHLVDGFRAGNVSAAAAANFFHFTEHSVTVAKAYLLSHGIDVRLDTYAHYADRRFEPDGRISKRADADLAELIFEYIPKEVI